MADHPAAKGLAALRDGDPRAALRWFDLLVEQEPNGVPGHFLRVEALDRLGDHAQARSVLEGLVTRFPFAEGACRERLALFSLRDGDRDSALALLERAAASGWANPDAVTAEPAFAKHASDPAFLAVLARARENARDAGE